MVQVLFIRAGEMGPAAAPLVPLMIERYGFYEGTGTPYRVDPQQILKVLDFLKSNSK